MAQDRKRAERPSHRGGAGRCASRLAASGNCAINSQSLNGWTADAFEHGAYVARRADSVAQSMMGVVQTAYPAPLSPT